MDVNNQLKISAAFLAIAIALVFYHFQQDNFPGSVSLYLGGLFFPYIAVRAGTPTARLWPIVLLGLLVLVFVKSASLYYLVTGLGLLYLLEISWGRLNPLPFLLVVVVAPLFRYISHIWSFPIRLEMSQWVGKSLSAIGMDVAAVGNTIMVKGMAYEIEPGCIGLKMIGTAMVCCLLVLAFFVRKREWHITWLEAVSAMGWGMLLTIFANYIRLLGLVLFDIPPESLMHDLMGLFSLVVYVIIPFYGSCWWWVKRNKEEAETSDKHDFSTRPLFFKRKLLFGALILVGLIGTGFQFQKATNLQTVNPAFFQHLDGYTQTTERFNVVKLTRPGEVVYIKPPAGALQSAHDPRICWQGSGFSFYKIRKSTIDDLPVYLAEIRHDDLILETAWWYDNGQVQTTEEWYWRWWTLMGEKDFYLINVSVDAGGDLDGAVRAVRR